MKNQEKRTLRQDIDILIATLKLIHTMDRGYIPIVIGHALLSSLRYFTGIVLSAYILDELLGDQSLRRLGLYVGILVGSVLIMKLGADYLMRLREAKDGKLRHSFYGIISEKVLTLDYEYIDHPKLHNLRQQILEFANMKGISYTTTLFVRRIVSSMVDIALSISIAVSLFVPQVGVTSALGNVMNAPYWVIAFVAGIGALIWIQTRSSRIFGELQRSFMHNVMEINRIGIYMMGNVCSDYRNGKDLRLYRGSQLVWDALKDFANGVRKYILIYVKEKFGVESHGILVNGVLTGMIYVFVILKAAVGAITIGSVMKYVAAVQRLSSSVSTLMSSLTEVRVNCQFLDYIQQLLNLPDIKYHGTLPVEKRSDHAYTIEFRDVSFKYPGSEEYVLKNVSLKLNIGERLAVVGMNGAGKTTFIKLLARLYDPTDGVILLNGIDIQKYDYDEYLSLFSVVFQDFHMFAFSAAQNISGQPQDQVDEKRVADAMEKSGLADRLKTLPRGIHTSVMQNFDKEGVDFSGGELQKMAIARALYKDAPIVILDEPTASLDPISEFEIYSHFDQLVGNKTAIYISHRLSSCRFCHDILVFHEGEVIQRGSHDELIRYQDHKYYEMWQAQAQYYNEAAKEQTA